MSETTRRTSGRSIPVIGIAGGIGSGKSSVARALASLGALVSESDVQIRAALETEDIKRTLEQWWGAEVFNDSGDIDRSAIAKIVFNDPQQRTRLEALLHPYALLARTALIEQGEREGVPAVVIDAPLLFEADLDAECDAIIYVDTPRETRVKRLQETRGWDEQELARREKAQLPLEQKRKKSDHVLINEGDEADLHSKVRSLLARIRQAFLQDRQAHPSGSRPASSRRLPPGPHES